MRVDSTEGAHTWMTDDTKPEPQAKRRGRRGKEDAFVARWGRELTDIALGKQKYILEEDLTAWRQQEKNAARSGVQSRTRKERGGVGGYVTVYSVFLRTYSRLSPPITPIEAMLVIHALDGPWHPDEQRGIRYGLLATRMGASLDVISRLVAGLRRKKNSSGVPYLKATYNRVDKEWTLNFEGLFEAILEYIHRRAEQREAQAWDRESREGRLVSS